MKKTIWPIFNLVPLKHILLVFSNNGFRQGKGQL